MMTQIAAAQMDGNSVADVVAKFVEVSVVICGLAPLICA
jgi:hypothetical protein